MPRGSSSRTKALDKGLPKSIFPFLRAASPFKTRLDRGAALGEGVGVAVRDAETLKRHMGISEKKLPTTSDSVNARKCMRTAPTATLADPPILPTRT